MNDSLLDGRMYRNTTYFHKRSPVGEYSMMNTFQLGWVAQKETGSAPFPSYITFPLYSTDIETKKENR